MIQKLPKMLKSMISQPRELAPCKELYYNELQRQCNNPKVDQIYVGFLEHWETTKCQVKFSDGRVDVRDISSFVSTWATPGILLKFKNGEEQLVPCYLSTFC